MDRIQIEGALSGWIEISAHPVEGIPNDNGIDSKTNLFRLP